jgi:DnaJ-domain-containing protein 1
MGLLLAMAWADGKLQDEEKQGIRDASSTLNLPKEFRERLEKLMQQAPPLAELKVEGLPTREREFAFVASAWMANVAAGIDEREEALLKAIGDKLELSDVRQGELAGLALDLPPPDEGESWSEGLVRLFKTIPAKVEPSLEESEVEFE